jgi:hypothetical protein
MLASMITCKRPDDCVLKAVSSFLAGAPTDQELHVWVDGTDAGYLGDWAHHGRVKLHVGPLDPTAGPRQRCMMNHARAHSINEQGVPILVFEDDAQFVAGWYDCFRRSVEEAEATAPGGFILALFAGHAPRAPKRCATAPYHPSDFYSSTALYFDPPVAEQMRDEFAGLAEARAAGSDVAIKRFAKLTKTPIFHTNPHLVQHIGDYSVINKRYRTIRSPSAKI